jgi:tRNA(adenine34) deaminase
MSRALLLAERAQAEGEVPVGAVVVVSGEIVGEGWNQSLTLSDPTAHAEIQAIRSACRHLGNYRLPGSELYVTLEPCSMCVGAMIHARISRLIFAASDPKTGAAGGVSDLVSIPQHKWRMETRSGLLADRCSEILVSFFKSRR